METDGLLYTSSESFCASTGHTGEYTVCFQSHDPWSGKKTDLTVSPMSLKSMFPGQMLFL